ncbi:MAG: cytochrome c biogenesis protein CcsA [Paramuribaculum sp.]|nr:cytochrome c biogenesis protein CcsA [Paramuribaculum sp.]
MRLIKLILFFLLPLGATAVPASGTQVRVNGRVATFESVLGYCGGDTARAVSICDPLPVESPYLSKARINVERFYNAFNPAWICAIAAVACLLLPCSRLILILLLLLLSGEFALRWWLGEGIPLVGVTDVASGISIALGATAVCRPHLRRFACPAIIILMCCVALWGSHPAVRAVNPTLQSAWLPVHVCLMVGAYSLFLVSTIVAAVRVPRRGVFRSLIAGEVFLAAGIAIGSLWAAEAWGSYWSWDPKETAALVTFLVYLALIVLWSKMRPGFLRAAVICAFVAVVFTWIGVSGGLHSY